MNDETNPTAPQLPQLEATQAESQLASAIERIRQLEAQLTESQLRPSRVAADSGSIGQKPCPSCAQLVPADATSCPRCTYPFPAE